MAKLKDVAKQAGVSTAAASAVLGGRSSTIGTSPTTRQRIIEAAEQLGYTPSPAALSLSTGQTNTLGLVISDPVTYLSHPNGAINLASFCNAAAASNYRVLLVTTDREGSIDPRLMDGCVVFGWVDDDTAAIIERMARQIPVASTYRQIPGGITVTINEQTEEKHRQAARHLYQFGHRHLAVVDLPVVRHAAQHIFEQVAAEQKLDVQLDAFTDDWESRTYESVHEIAALQPMPTAVYAFDDDYARALIARLAHDGKRVPYDLSVFSGSTHSDGFQITPPLTGIDSHYEQQIIRLIEVFTGALRRKEDLEQIVIEPPAVELIERGSCASVVF